MQTRFEKSLQTLQTSHKDLLQRTNKKLESDNGIYNRYLYPVLTSNHTPVFWRYDLNNETNPYLMERFGINSVFNAGALKLNGKHIVIAGVQSSDRKSFIAVAESANGIDNFEFWDYPITIPELSEEETNMYDIRIVQHEDGWIYGIFCYEKQYPGVDPDNQTATAKQCGIARTTDLKTWERLADLITPSPRRRNVILHPELVNGKYAFYTSPQEGFTEIGKGEEIGFGLSDSINKVSIQEEIIIDQKDYYPTYESKSGLGPAPIKTQHGWIHLANGVTNTAAGHRHVLYIFMTDLKNLTNIIYKPAGYFLAPEGEEIIGQVPNMVSSNGWIAGEDGTIYIYYASASTRLHVATTTLDQLLDFVMNSAPDGLSTGKPGGTLNRIIDNNKALMHLRQSTKDKTVK